jgi:hypothetical protein
VVLQVYDILKDDRDLRQLKELGPEAAGAEFDRLRNEYFLHPEFRHYVVELGPEQRLLADTFQALGFQVAHARPAHGV